MGDAGAGVAGDGSPRAGMRGAAPLADAFIVEGPDATGCSTALFYSCNTIVTVRALAPRSALAGGARVVRDAFRRYESLFSRTLPGSDVSRLNAAGGRAVPIAPETADLLRASLGYCAASRGRFDVTIGSASRLWDFHRGIAPEPAALAEAARHVGWRAVRLERRDGKPGGGPTWRARLADPKAMVDLGGTAKGWMADRACEILAAHGIADFAVSLGGNVAARGTGPAGDGWQVAVRDPWGARPAERLAIRDASAVTSGTYERAFARDGRLYHHVLEPTTGMPVETDAVSATLVCARSADAEGFSTTVLALGMEAGAAFARERPEIEAVLLIGADGRVARV